VTILRSLVAMDAVAPLFAAGGDWIDVLVPALFAIVWVVGQVMNIFRRAAADRFLGDGVSCCRGSGSIGTNLRVVHTSSG
jgi:hypothetical protein